MNYESLYYNHSTVTLNVPPELSGNDRSNVRLAVADRNSGYISLYPNFSYIRDVLKAGDLLIFNDSLMLPSSLEINIGRLKINCRIHIGQKLSEDEYLAEVRPKDINSLIETGDILSVLNSEKKIEITGKYGDFPRYHMIRFVERINDLNSFLLKFGKPIFYENITSSFDIKYYVNVFQSRYGSSEYPSASRPFNSFIITELSKKGVRFSTLTLHCNMASLEKKEFLNSENLLPENYEIPEETVSAIESAAGANKRVIAVGTTVARAILSSVENGKMANLKGETKMKITAETNINPLSGIITGVHEIDSSHYDLISAFAGEQILSPLGKITSLFGLGGHEFGDSVLLL
ncbi:MAG: S-adenosylmethionine:tRNA ribosyltransferase-isomerase [Thermoplasmataceae archaeon]